jgi:hypothetical protein
MTTSGSTTRDMCYNRDAPQAACTLVLDAFKQSTESRPTSIARIVQRRAAIQNCCRCPVQQNLWVDPPVIRGENVRSHHRQHVFQATDCGVGSQIAATDPVPPFLVVDTSKLFIMRASYERGAPHNIKRCLTSLIYRRQCVDEYSSKLAGCDQIAEHPGPSGRLPPIDTGSSPQAPASPASKTATLSHASRGKMRRAAQLS